MTRDHHARAVAHHYNRLAMIRRMVPIAVASAVLFAPSIPSEGDGVPLLRPLTSAAQAGAGEGTANAKSPQDDGRSLRSATLTATSPVAGAPTDAPGFDDDAATPSFGFGAYTSFFPSDSPRELVLTFDDGPDLKFTPIVLDELDRRGLKAIFFVTGHRLVGDRPEDIARRELVRKLAAHGHLIANHTMTHRNLCQFPAELGPEIDANSEIIAAATGVRPLLFRMPYGARCRALDEALAERRLVSVGWNLDPQDWKSERTADVLTYLQSRLTRLNGRGILLLHDTHAASVFAVGPLLDWIARENQRAVREGRTPIVMRDYAVFLPERRLPSTGFGRLTTSLLRELPAPTADWVPPADAVGTIVAAP